MSEVTAAIIRRGKVVEHVALDETFAAQGDSAFMWVEVFNPQQSDLLMLQDRFRLHSLAVRDSLSAAQIPKLDVYEDQLFVVLKVARLKNDEIRYAQIDAFVSNQHIISVRHDEEEKHVHAHEEFTSGPRSTRPGPDVVLHAMMDFVVNDYFPVVQMIEDEVLAMEQRLLDAFLDREEVTRLFRMRREAIQLQHVMTRMADVCGKLTNLEVPCIGPEIKPYFRDVHDQLMRLDGMIGGLIDVIRAVFEASTLLEQQRQGASTRKLAGWAAILGAPTAIAALYGMYYPNVPALHAPSGYAVIVAMMGMICVGLFIRFKRLRWL